MTDVSNSPRKVWLRRRLVQIGVATLEEHGWRVEKIQRAGKSSVRRITKGSLSRVVSIRTTQDTWIAFPRTNDDRGWVTLSEVDAVVAVSVDDRYNPKYGQVHLIEGDEMRERFDRAYKARKAAGHSIPRGRGVWVSLYDPDAKEPVSQVGGGAGLDHPPIGRVLLEPFTGSVEPEGVERADTDDEPFQARADSEDRSLTISEAKRLLALSLGVDPSNIKITVEA